MEAVRARIMHLEQLALGANECDEDEAEVELLGGATAHNSSSVAGRVHASASAGSGEQWLAAPEERRLRELRASLDHLRMLGGDFACSPHSARCTIAASRFAATAF